MVEKTRKRISKNGNTKLAKKCRTLGKSGSAKKRGNAFPKMEIINGAKVFFLSNNINGSNV